ncbi:type II secretion system protein [Neobacillus mesonae]|uniref:type IV pilus modification PilV family protein n=1 Tax=Neobacillus mesonae TaxID=1193713 RepID=UPI00203C2792|nr:type II secretion system protein [Neobacillus mesonae]MCM3568394.1 type II secretion system GspH family protein [Neobacillus mesonae]
MKKIRQNQSGITLVEVLLATVLLGFIVSVFVILSGSIAKTNTDSGKETQAMAYATIISELVKCKYNLKCEESSIYLESTVMDKDSAANGDPDYSISQPIHIPSDDFEDIKYISGKKTGYQYKIKISKAAASENYLEIQVTVRNLQAKTEETLVFRHNFFNS